MRKKIASDNNEFLIAMFQNLDKVYTLPEFITKEHYTEVRKCFYEEKTYFPNWYIGAVGFLASYNGRFFDGGYAGTVNTKIGTIRNYYDEAKRNLIKQISNLQDIEFSCKDYREYTSFENCLFYMDIPYKNMKKYSTSKEFNHEEFWKWCRKISEKNIVLISEQEAPMDFDCIWQQKINRTMRHDKSIKATEKLFEIRA